MIDTTTRQALIQHATVNIRDTLTIALEHDDTHRALVVYDTEHPLTDILTEAYRVALPQGTFLDFNAHTKEEILAAFDALEPKDLVVLVQSGDFRLNDFRIRIQLFQRHLKVIDHRHLERHTADTWETYIRALAYDPAWYRTMGPKVSEILARTETLRVLGTGTELTVTGGLEMPKLNIGDYTNIPHIGGTFPIGEVFTEAKNLHAMNGSIQIYAFANAQFLMETHEPFTLHITDGILTAWDAHAPASFAEVVAQIQTNERPLVREIGFGLNRAITRATPLNDITSFERTLGMHISLGEKHTVYKKPGIMADKTRFHVDLFPLVTEAYADDTLIFKDGTYVV